MCVYLKKTAKTLRGFALRGVRGFLCDLGVSFAIFAVNFSKKVSVTVRFNGKKRASDRFFQSLSQN
jgi:hypothetical protein